MRSADWSSRLSVTMKVTPLLAPTENKVSEAGLSLSCMWAREQVELEASECDRELYVRPKAEGVG